MSDFTRMTFASAVDVELNWYVVFEVAGLAYSYSVIVRIHSVVDSRIGIYYEEEV